MGESLQFGESNQAAGTLSYGLTGNETATGNQIAEFEHDLDEIQTGLMNPTTVSDSSGNDVTVVNLPGVGTLDPTSAQATYVISRLTAKPNAGITNLMQTDTKKDELKKTVSQKVG